MDSENPADVGVVHPAGSGSFPFRCVVNSVLSPIVGTVLAAHCVSAGASKISKISKSQRVIDKERTETCAKTFLVRKRRTIILLVGSEGNLKIDCKMTKSP